MWRVVVKADETFFLRSSKGQRTGRKSRKRGGRASRKERGMDLIPVLVARDRSGGGVGQRLTFCWTRCPRPV